MLDAHLTRPQGEVLAAMQAATVPGMAHWALSGPEGTACFQCKHWATAPNGRYKRSNGVLCARRCRQFTKMNRANLGGAGPAVEPEAPACKYFAPAKAAPDLRIKPKEPKDKASPAKAPAKVSAPGFLRKRVRRGR